MSKYINNLQKSRKKKKKEIYSSTFREKDRRGRTSFLKEILKIQKRWSRQSKLSKEDHMIKIIQLVELELNLWSQAVYALLLLTQVINLKNEPQIW